MLAMAIGYAIRNKLCVGLCTLIIKSIATIRLANNEEALKKLRSKPPLADTSPYVMVLCAAAAIRPISSAKKGFGGSLRK